MKLGLTLSSSAHALVLFWGLAFVSAPEAMIVEDVEALPVDIIPIEELTKEVQGDKEAEVTETPAPEPTEKEEPVPEAENVGETQDDTESVEAPEKAPVPVKKQAEAPEPEPKPIEKAEPQPEPEPEPQVEELIEEAAKEQEVAALPDQVTPIEEEPPVEEPEPQEEAQQLAALPDTIPVPQVRPKPKLVEKSGGEKAKKKNNEDEIQKLLNKDDPSAGGAKASKQTASLGNRKGGDSKLSKTDEAALRGAIESCAVDFGGRRISDNFTMTFEIKMNPDGTVNSIPFADHNDQGTKEEIAHYGRLLQRAIKKCSHQGKFKFLTKNEYETWAILAPTFYVAEMFQ